MTALPEEACETTDGLDTQGNTTAATGKGFCIGSTYARNISLNKVLDSKSQLMEPAMKSIMASVYFEGN